MPVFANLVGKPDGSGRVSGIGLISVGGRPKAARCQTAIHIYRLVCLPVGLRESRGNNSGCFSTSAQTLSGISNFFPSRDFGAIFWRRWARRARVGISWVLHLDRRTSDPQTPAQLVKLDRVPSGRRRRENRTEKSNS